MAVGFILTLLLLVMVVRATYAVEHVVGGSAGWAPAVDYAKWATGETFYIGDTLRFDYDIIHSVNQVTLENYNTCTGDNASSAVYTGGSTTITLNDRGPMFFICPTPGHCVGGMKLSIIVFAGGPTTSAPPPVPGGMIYSDPYNVTIEVTPFSGGSFVVASYLVIGVSMVLVTVLGFMVL